VKKGRKIIAYIATSAYGYIARSDGNVDWLNRPRPADEYGMGVFYKSLDAIIWGRKTYEPVLQKFASSKTHVIPIFIAREFLSCSRGTAQFRWIRCL